MQAEAAHEPGVTLAGVTLAALAQRHGQPRPAIGAAAPAVDLAQLLSELGTLAGTGARRGRAPAVVAAARHAEGRAQITNAVLRLQRFHAREALPFGSARMPKAFF
ncbi:MAG: hypothetical protein WCF18_22100 [Chthoniobacteraceae bacterium]